MSESPEARIRLEGAQHVHASPKFQNQLIDVKIANKLKDQFMKDPELLAGFESVYSARHAGGLRGSISSADGRGTQILWLVGGRRRGLSCCRGCRRPRRLWGCSCGPIGSVVTSSSPWSSAHNNLPARRGCGEAVCEPQSHPSCPISRATLTQRENFQCWDSPSAFA